GLGRAGDGAGPAPLFWESFRQQGGRRLDSAPAPAAWRWGLGPAFAALALAVAVLSVPALRPLRHDGEAGLPLPAWTPQLSEEDAGLSLIQALGPTEDELKADSGDVAAVDSLGELSEDESRALSEALQGELKGRNL